MQLVPDPVSETINTFNDLLSQYTPTGVKLVLDVCLVLYVCISKHVRSKRKGYVLDGQVRLVSSLIFKKNKKLHAHTPNEEPRFTTNQL